MAETRFNSRAKAETIVREIVSLGLRGSSRAADLEMFQIGPDIGHASSYPGVNVEGFALHVQSAWHISDRRGIVAASRDLEFPRTGAYGDFDPNVLGETSREEKLLRLFSQALPLEIMNVRVDRLGAVYVALAGGLALRVFPDTSDQEDEPEYWRLIKHGGWHLVASSRGFTLID